MEVENIFHPSYPKISMYTVVNLRKGPEGPSPNLFWVKEKRIVEGRKAGKAEATKNQVLPSLSSRSGSATGIFFILLSIFSFGADKENLFNNKELLNLVIISLILLTLVCGSGVTF